MMSIMDDSLNFACQDYLETLKACTAADVSETTILFIKIF